MQSSSYTAFSMRRHRSTIGCVALIIAIVFLLPRRSALHPTGLKPTQSKLHCPQSSIANDVLLVMRTGATESLEKLPVHFDTTFACAPYYVVYSDLEESINGHQVLDVLDGVQDVLKNSHPDFELYRQLKESGRAGTDPQNWPASQRSGGGGVENQQNPGWKLDKWKFLPMVEKALHYRPKAKWYVFIESDTYLVWSNLLEYLARIDASKPLYIGKPMYIGEDLFAHGGSGFVVSNPAMKKVTNLRKSKLEEYDALTDRHWAGDCVLGKALKAAGVPLSHAFPHFQAENPSVLDPEETKMDRPVWCYPALTYHHVSPEEAKALFEFENEWFGSGSKLLRHQDVFRYFIFKLRRWRGQWDNLSGDVVFDGTIRPAIAKLAPNEQVLSNMAMLEQDAHKSPESCRQLCKNRPDCIQFSYHDRTCSLSSTFKLGRIMKKSSIVSGWRRDKIEGLFDRLDQTCSGKDWFLP